jgi:hypothetical protein
MEKKEKIEDLIERAQTRIEMIRTESRILSHKIDRMQEQRHKLQLEKSSLKGGIAERVLK